MNPGILHPEGVYQDHLVCAAERAWQGHGRSAATSGRPFNFAGLGKSLSACRVVGEGPKSGALLCSLRGWSGMRLCEWSFTRAFSYESDSTSGSGLHFLNLGGVHSVLRSGVLQQ